LVVISGRWTKDLIPLLGLEEPPEIWGSHGWERKRPGKETEIGRLEEETVRSLVEAEEWARAEGLEARCERKPACLALHWRGLAEERARGLRRRALTRWSAIAAPGSLEVREFDGGVELRAEGRSKGFAVETVLGEAGEGAVAAYLGDDLTDEDAFHALEGRGLRVLVRREERPTQADLLLTPPDDLLWFLRRYAEAARKGEGRE
jgi:trehalose 6-phosphate phosphatase